jgi:hypothetical protein
MKTITTKSHMRTNLKHATSVSATLKTPVSEIYIWQVNKTDITVQNKQTIVQRVKWAIFFNMTRFILVVVG